MIRYRYNQQVSPPAPFAFVTISSIDQQRSLGELPAQLDTAAYRTVLPVRFVEQLGLAQVRQIEVEGLGARVSLLPTYLVRIQIHDMPPHTLEVYGCAGESHVLLGRDVLNKYRVLLDGPSLAFEIG
jgi:hypothetical protein